MSTRHLVVVGLMGAGKTEVGRACAARLGRDWIDTDDLAVVLASQPFEAIWAEGEATFRAWERQAVADAAASPSPLVISCGGGVVLDAENRAALRATGVVVWLRAAVETLAARVGDGSGRPLLAGDPVAALRRLAAAREPAYSAAADAVVDTDDLSVEDVVDAVLTAARIEGC
jgi:shikimate kinase